MNKPIMTTISRNDRVATIWVKYRLVDDYHVFTSHDVRGLYVASKDRKHAFDSVAKALSELVSLKKGSPCDVLPAESFDDFYRKREAETAIPNIMGDRSYVVRCAA